jgi:hypothetical protein
MAMPLRSLWDEGILPGFGTNGIIRNGRIHDPLFGEIVLTSAAGTTRLTLDPSTAAVFAAHLPHRVEARQDSAFVLVMGGQA